MLLLSFFGKLKSVRIALYHYNHGHNVMRIFDVLPNFPFTASEMKPGY